MRYPLPTPGSLVAVILLLLCVTLLCAYELFVDEVELANYIEDKEIIDFILENGIDVNSISTTALKDLGINDYDIEEILKVRENFRVMKMSQLRKLLKHDNSLFIYEEYLCFSNRKGKKFELKGLVNGKYNDAEYQFAANVYSKINDNKLSLVVNNQDAATSAKFCSWSESRSNINYAIGNFKPHFGMGLVWQGSHNQNKNFLPTTSLWNKPNRKGALLTYRSDNLSITTVYNYDADIPDKTVQLPNEDAVACTYGLNIKYYDVGILLSRQIVQKEYVRDILSVAVKRDIGISNLNLEYVYDSSSSIIMLLRTKWELLEQDVIINYVNDSLKHPFSNYYNDYYYCNSFEKYAWSLKYRIGTCYPHFRTEISKSKEMSSYDSMHQLGIRVSGKRVSPRFSINYKSRLDKEEWKGSAIINTCINKWLANRLILSSLIQGDKFATIVRFRISYSDRSFQSFVELTASTSEFEVFGSDSDYNNEVVEIDNSYRLETGGSFKLYENSKIKGKVGYNILSEKLTTSIWIVYNY